MSVHHYLGDPLQGTGNPPGLRFYTINFLLPSTVKQQKTVVFKLLKEFETKIFLWKSREVQYLNQTFSNRADLVEEQGVETAF